MGKHIEKIVKAIIIIAVALILIGILTSCEKEDDTIEKKIYDISVQVNTSHEPEYQQVFSITYKKVDDEFSHTISRINVDNINETFELVNIKTLQITGTHCSGIVIIKNNNEEVETINDNNYEIKYYKVWQ